MIDKKLADEQIDRFSGLKWFPKVRTELIRAIMAAETDIIAVAVVNDLVDYSEECPSPAALRRKCYDENEKRDKVLRSCSKCGGSRSQTVWMLVTYHGRSLTVKRIELLPNCDAEAARQLSKNLQWDDGSADNQQIVTGARACECRPEDAVVARCDRCQDCGYYGGRLPPHSYAGPWKWCDCIAGRERQEREPNLVDEANANREKLIARFASATFRGVKRNTPGGNMAPLVDEVYLGEF